MIYLMPLKPLLMLLYDFYDKLKDAIIEKLCKLLRDKFDYGQYFRSVVDIVANPKLVKTVLDLGADIHKIERTIFLRIVMTGTIYNPLIRETVKALLNANPGLENNETVISLNLKRTKNLTASKLAQLGLT